MITPEALADLKALWLKASKPPMVLAPLGISRQLVQLSTLKPGALEVAKFTQDPAEPEKVAVCSAMDNAAFIKACFEWVPKLIEEVEKFQAEIVATAARRGADISDLGYTPPQHDSAADPVVGVPGPGQEPRARVQRHARSAARD